MTSLFDKKKPKRYTKGLLTGVIIGGAIGSIIGIASAPQSGRKTRDALRRSTEQTWSRVRDVLSGQKTTKTSQKSFWHRLNALFSTKSKKSKNQKNPPSPPTS